MRDPSDTDAPPAGHADPARLLAIIDAMLAELRPGRAPRPSRLDDALDTDLGIDSLSRVELVARIERVFAATLPDDVALAARTPRELLAALGIAEPSPARREAIALAAPREVAGVPADAVTLVDVFAWHVERHPDREHLTLLEGDDVRAAATYAALWREAHEVAAGLAARGVSRGDTVALMLPTGLDFFRVFLAAVILGAVPVPLYPPTRWAEIEEHVRGRAAILANCGARILVTVREARFIARILRARLAALDDVVTVHDLRGARAGLALRGAGSDLAMLQYTSGSTADPRGVMLTHDNLLANIRAIGRAVHATSADRFVSWLPLYHDMGLIGAWMATAYHAIPLVLMAPTSFLARPVRWLRAIHRFRGTLSAGPNFAYEIAATKIADEELAGLDLSSWRIAFNGAEPVRAGTLARFAARMAPHGFAREALTPVYGLAEAAVGLTFPPLGRGPRIDRVDAGVLARDGVVQRVGDDVAAALEVVSCGMPLAGHAVRILATGGRDAPPGVEGRIQFRGPSATQGYFRNPRATAALIDGGWLDTGDVGYLADDELFVTSRAKDLVKRGGHALHPYDLEAAVAELDGVRRGGVAVFGMADHVSGTERLIVVAETRERDTAARAALVARIQALARLHFGGPADDVVLATPHTVRKTSSGKIRRAACRELYERGSLTAPSRGVARQLAALALAALVQRTRQGVRTVGDVAWGVHAGVLFVVASAVGLLLLAIVPGLARRQRVVHAVARLLVKGIGLPVEVGERGELPTHSALLAVNHASYVDAIVLAAALPPGWRFAAKRAFAGTPLVGFAMRRAGVYFVERDDPARGIADTRQLAAALRQGERLVYFPEGTFTRAVGLRPFRLGGFVAAATAGAAVVPAVLRGTRAVLPDGRWLPRHRRVSLTLAPALTADGHGWSAALRLRDRVRGEMLARSDEPDLSDALP